MNPTARVALLLSPTYAACLLYFSLTLPRLLPIPSSFAQVLLLTYATASKANCPTVQFVDMIQALFNVTTKYRLDLVPGRDYIVILIVGLLAH